MLQSTRLTLAVTNNVTYIEGRISSPVYQGLKKVLRYKPQDAFFRMRQLEEKKKAIERKTGVKSQWTWDGYEYVICRNKKWCKCDIKKDGIHFPTGLYSKVIKFFKDNKIPYTTSDERKQVKKSISFGMSRHFEIRDYQIDTVNKCANRERGIAKMATGSGKNAVSARLIKELGVSPFIFYVPSIDLMKQTQDEFSRFLIRNGENAKIGAIGGGVFDPQDITIMTIQTAVRACGEKYIKYDAEDHSKEDLSLDDKRKEILSFIMGSKGIIGDECITGDSIVYVKNYGHKNISELNNFIGEDILSFNGTNVVWEKITCFMDKGQKSIIRIKTKSGKTIKCTKNHLIKTARGWIQAGRITKKDKILSFADVGVANRLMSEENAQVSTQNMFSAIKSKSVVKNNGKECLDNLTEMPQNANVDAEKKYHLSINLWNLLSKIVGIENIENIFMDMIKDQKNGIWFLCKMRNRPFLALFLEILRCVFLVREAGIQDYLVLMDWFKENGRNINRCFYIDYLRIREFIKMLDMEKLVYFFTQDVCRVLKKYIESFILTIRKILVMDCLTSLVTLDWHGGCAMMEAITMDHLGCIQRDTLLEKTELSKNGLMINMATCVLDDLRESISTSNVDPKPQKKSLKLFQNISQDACHTRYDEVVLIEEIGSDNVYDITVDNTNCFFANGLLVHNCQHWAAETCKTISDYSVSARYKFGFSATPWRDLGDDILIDACFGKEIVNINASFLIDRGYLVPPNIYFIKMKVGKTIGYSYPTIYKNNIVENAARNNIVSDIATKMADEGRTILILVRQISHGKILNKLIEDSVFLHGACSGKKRKAHLDLMRKQKAPVTIASVIFDEGIDCCALDTLILAGSGKCLSGESLVTTSKGFIRLEDIKINDNIKSYDGFKENRIIKCHSQGVQSIFKIKLSNGQCIKATKNHRFRILRNGRIKFCNVDNLQNDDCMLVPHSSMMFGNDSDISEIFDIPLNNCSLVAELLGYIASEGNVQDRETRISNVFNGDCKNIEKISKATGIPLTKKINKYKLSPDGKNNGWYYSCCSKYWCNIFRDIGIAALSKNMDVPDIILRSSMNSQCAFLRAFFDGKSNVNSEGIDLCLASEKMLKTIQIMLLNFGIYSSVRSKKIQEPYKVYRLTITGTNNLNIFYKYIDFNSLSRRKKIKPLLGRKPNTNCLLIKGIKTICKDIRSATKKTFSTDDHKKMNAVNAKLAQSSKQEFTQESLKKFLEYYNDIKSSKFKYLSCILKMNCFFIPIVDISYVGEENTYDLEMDYVNSKSCLFTANGIINHNSQTRALQRVGRTLRPYTYFDKTKKEYSIVIDFEDHYKYMLSHSRKRKKIYSTEERFNVSYLDI